MKKTAKKRKIVESAKLSCLLMFSFSLLLGGCSYHDKQFSYFNMLDDKKRTLSNKQAAEKFWSSVRPVSTLSDSHYRLGLHYQQKGEYEKAIGEFAKALRNDSSYCKAYNGIAMSYDALRRCEPAHASYYQALKCAPDQAYVFNNFACSSLLCGDYGKGVELLLKAERLAGDNNRIKNNLKIAQTIVIQENISNYISAVQMPDPVAELTPTPTVPESEQTLPHPVYEIPEFAKYAISDHRDVNNTQADNRPAPTAEVVGETPDRLSSAYTPGSADTVKLVAEKSKRIVSPLLITPSLNQATVAIEVSNGNGATGMAGRSAGFLRGHGFSVRSITNAKHFRFEESVIFYKEGYLEVAKELAEIIPGVQNLEKVDTLTKTSTGIRVLLGRDLVSMRFPDGFSRIAGSPDQKTEQLLTATVTVSNNLVHY